MDFDTSKISVKDCYQLLTGAVVPRPIAWISTLSGEGVANLAPFSFFTVASCSPPVLAFTQVNPPDSHEKDTLRNLRETRQCVVNIVSADMAEQMNASSADYHTRRASSTRSALCKHRVSVLHHPGWTERGFASNARCATCCVSLHNLQEDT